jgi:hypothetical protein
VSTGWIYNDLAFDEALIPINAIGFIYKITNTVSGRAYIGKKLLQFQKTAMKTVTLKSGIKKKKKIRSKVRSDWLSYYGSSENLTADILLLGNEVFTREVLFFCSNKGAMGYHEAQVQMDERVLENQHLWYNGAMQLRIHWKHVSPRIYP